MVASRTRAASFVFSACVIASLASACTGRAPRSSDDVDAGVGGEGEGEAQEGEGEEGEGESIIAEGEGEGEDDAGPIVDAGNGFDLGDLLVDGGVPGLECLPEAIPELSIAGAFDALGLGFYTGSDEDGVRCGEVICAEAVPCCGLCGLAGCGVDITDAGEPAVCPLFTASYACDDEDDCGGDDICCFTLGGTACRAEEDCDFDVGSLREFFGDGGIVFPDAGLSDFDAGFLDGGFTQEPGEDGGTVDVPVVGPAAPLPDAGSLLDGIQATLEQGVPVCNSTFFDCEILQGEACCTSDRLVAVDLGFCLPALLCVGELLP